MNDKWTKALDNELLELISDKLSNNGKYIEAFKEFHNRHKEFSTSACATRWHGTLKLDNNVRVIKCKEEKSKKNFLMVLLSKAFQKFVDKCC